MGTGLILGQVVDAKDNRPIAGAIVQLSGGQGAPVITIVNGRQMATPPPPPASPRRVMTDSQGRFMFYSLPVATYSISANAAGYLYGNYGQTRPNTGSRALSLKDDQKTGNITIGLWRLAALTGTVLDEAGEPAINMNVRLLRRQIVNGRMRYNSANQARTDDRGIYRISGLSPGDYLVSVPTVTTTMPVSVVEAMQKAQSARDNGASQRDFSNQLNASNAPYPNSGGTRVGDAYVQNQSGFAAPQTETDKVFAYQTLFFSGATTSAQGTAITLAAGDERSNVDFQLRPIQTFKVTGSVTSPDGQAGTLGVRLLPANYNDFQTDNGLEVATTVTEADGKFTFLGVAPGGYVVKVLRVPRPAPMQVTSSVMTINGVVQTFTSVGGGLGGTSPQPPPPTDPTLFAELPVSLGDTDVTGISLSLQTGPRVTGRVEFDGATAKPQLGRSPSPVNISLNQTDGRYSGPITPPIVTANGQFTTMSMPPGKYMISANAPGWTLRSATLGGRDVADMPFDLTGGDVGGLVITFFDRPSQISGIVRNLRGEPEDGATVFILPADYRTQTEAGTIPRRLRTARSAADGKYSTGGLLPGDYLVVALTDMVLADASDPARALDQISRGATRVTIGESDKHTQDLTISQVQIR